MTVSGISGNLGVANIVLQQINLEMGSSGCTGNMSTYDFRLTSPAGTVLDFITDFRSGSAAVWCDIKFRDHSSLEKVSDYSSAVQSSYYPYSIGYYGVDTPDSFSTFNGEDPNGTWVFSVREGTFSEVSFEKVELVFGAPINVEDLTGGGNDECSGAGCIDGTGVFLGSNNGYASTDPNYPGGTVDGCSWNGANNNSAWMEFYASGTSAYITISGMANSSGTGSNDMQVLVLEDQGSCSTPTQVVTGGCPDDESINNQAYLSANGGGTSSGNVYVNGITANTEFNLSGLTVGDRYYLYVDGNGGASSTFYVEISGGVEDCSIALPVELLSLQGQQVDNTIRLSWVTTTEINNDYFQIEKHAVVAGEGVWNSIGFVNGGGTTNYTQEYSFVDDNPVLGENTYRLKQVDYDGRFEYKGVVSVELRAESGLLMFPNPANDMLTVMLGQDRARTQVEVVNVLGRVIPVEYSQQQDVLLFQTESLPAGSYILRLRIGAKTEVVPFVVHH